MSKVVLFQTDKSSSSEFLAAERKFMLRENLIQTNNELIRHNLDEPVFYLIIFM